jgi:hypothetical protein
VKTSLAEADGARHVDRMTALKQLYVHGYFAIDAAEGQIVDLVAEGRNICTLGGIDLDDEDVLSTPLHMIGKFKAKGREAAFVFAQARAVDPDGGGGHDSFEIDEDALPTRGGRQFEAAAIYRDKFVELFVEAVPGQLDVGVRHHDALEGGVVEAGSDCGLSESRTIAPISIDGEN